MKLREELIALWYRFRPIGRQYRSKKAWLEHCHKTGKSPDGITPPQQ